jgi:lactate dehydrogenase-like 2-hydroxyacid dehydrogenase
MENRMSKPHILIMGPYLPPLMQELEKAYETHCYWQIEDQAGFLKSHGTKIKAIATRGDVGASAELLQALPNLEFIAVFGVGVDAIDVAGAKARNIPITITSGVLHEDVADLAFALMLGIARQIPAGDTFVRSGKWAANSFPVVPRLYGKRIGILGMGQIGQAIAKRAEGFAMKISYHTRSKRDDVNYAYHATPEALAKDSDFLVAALSGGKPTAGIVSADVLKALGPNGFFINIARGSVVDEQALLAALEKNEIAGAALDVFLNEPKIDERFFKLENTVLHPHQGSATHETRKDMADLVVANLASHFAGKGPLTPI